MNCEFCQKEHLTIAASGVCVECNAAACIHPSGRAFNIFHGQHCCYANCHQFTCKFDAHEHAKKHVTRPITPNQPLYTCFPWLSLQTGLAAAAATEASFGDRKDEPLPQILNEVLTGFLAFVSPRWSRDLLAHQSAEEVVSDEQGTVRAPLRTRAYVLSPKLLGRSVPTMVEHILGGYAQYLKQNASGLVVGYLIPQDVEPLVDQAYNTAKRFSLDAAVLALSPRLHAFMLEAAAGSPPYASRSRPDTSYIDFQPSKKLLQMPLSLTANKRSQTFSGYAAE